MNKRIHLSLFIAVLLVLALNSLAFGQVLHIAIPQDPDSFDPVQTIAAATAEVAFNIYEGLVKATPEGGVEGALATHWEVNEDNTIYTFYLREALFHDGTPVTADDVISALNRARDPESAVRFGELSMIKDIRPTGGGVQIELHEANGAFIYTLAEVYAVIFPAHAGDLSRNPIGTGPYYLQEWKPNQQIELGRFEQHWSGKRPFFEEVKFLIIPDENSMVLNLKAGRVDLIPPGDVRTPSGAKRSAIEVVSSPMNLVQVFAINNARSPLTICSSARRWP